MVRARFTCEEKTQTPDGYRVKMRASSKDSEFFKWTPYGELTMGTINGQAAEQFIPGKDYFLDFTPVE